MTPAVPITVALVEDEPLTRVRLRAALAAHPEMSLVFETASALEIMSWLSSNPVQALLVDLGLPDRSGLDVIEHCRRVQPSCEVMVVSMFGDEPSMLRAFEAGARGYLLKDGTERELAAHVRALMAGGSPMSPIIARRLLNRWHSGVPIGDAPQPAPTPSKETQSPLTKRESEVLDLVARGFTYGEVASRLGVSITTVQTHVRGIYGKLDVNNKAEAIFEARSLGWVR